MCVKRENVKSENEKPTCDNQKWELVYVRKKCQISHELGIQRLFAV